MSLSLLSISTYLYMSTYLQMSTYLYLPTYVYPPTYVYLTIQTSNLEYMKSSCFTRRLAERPPFSSRDGQSRCPRHHPARKQFQGPALESALQWRARFAVYPHGTSLRERGSFFSGESASCEVPIPQIKTGRFPRNGSGGAAIYDACGPRQRVADGSAFSN